MIEKSLAPPKDLKKPALIAAAAALLIAVGGLLLRWHHAGEVTKWTDAAAVPSVSVLTPQRGVSGVQTVLPGNIQAWYEAPIYSRVSGYLKNWYFDYGAHVKKGQVLATIDTPDLDAELDAALATLRSTVAQTKVRAAEMEFARTTYVRWRDSPAGVVSEQERESKKADFDSAEARYKASLADVNSPDERSRAGSADCLCQHSEPSAGTRCSTTEGICGALRVGSSTQPNHLATADGGPASRRNGIGGGAADSLGHAGCRTPSATGHSRLLR